MPARANTARKGSKHNGPFVRLSTPYHRVPTPFPRKTTAVGGKQTAEFVNVKKATFVIRNTSSIKCTILTWDERNLEKYYEKHYMELCIVNIKVLEVYGFQAITMLWFYKTVIHAVLLNSNELTSSNIKKYIKNVMQ